MSRTLRLTGIIGIIGALCLHLAACGSGSGLSPVINKSPYRVIPANTVALEDDSVYSIAWRFGLDYQKIAKWNSLAKPYKIRPGQRLRLHSPGSAPAAPDVAVTPAVAASAIIPSTPLKPPPKPKPATTKKQPPPAATPGKWKWPAKGKLIGKFSPGKGQNGIRIAGADGSAIRSTAGGEVVYVGEGLRGYGKLIIVKHSPSYLSAYAHNRTIMVAEGDPIKSGQQIAQMGNSGADRTMLHFEIRKNGDPVDPLTFLK